jgi:hypothetical protein
MTSSEVSLLSNRSIDRINQDDKIIFSTHTIRSIFLDTVLSIFLSFFSPGISDLMHDAGLDEEEDGEAPNENLSGSKGSKGVASSSPRRPPSNSSQSHKTTAL